MFCLIFAPCDGADDLELDFPFDFEPPDLIVGGEDAAAGEYPFFVAWGGCGASLIWEDILLTAAHVRQLAAFAFAFIFSFSCLTSLSFLFY